MRNEILKKIQSEGLAILKLHEKLNEVNINHEFIDRKKQLKKKAKSHEEIENIDKMMPFGYQIKIREKDDSEKEILLSQGEFSYGIERNLIEVFNFENEPLQMSYLSAFDLIVNKKLNWFIKKQDEIIDDYMKEIEKEGK
jgi:hypothetical protein